MIFCYFCSTRLIMHMGDASRVRRGNAIILVHPDVLVANRGARILYNFSADFFGRRANKRRYAESVCFFARVMKGPKSRAVSLARVRVVVIFSFIIKLCTNDLVNAFRSPFLRPNFFPTLWCRICLFQINAVLFSDFLNLLDCFIAQPLKSTYLLNA